MIACYFIYGFIVKVTLLIVNSAPCCPALVVQVVVPTSALLEVKPAVTKSDGTFLLVHGVPLFKKVFQSNSKVRSVLGNLTSSISPVNTASSPA